jgi:hypothetical protein
VFAATKLCNSIRPDNGTKFLFRAVLGFVSFSAVPPGARRSGRTREKETKTQLIGDFVSVFLGVGRAWRAG